LNGYKRKARGKGFGEVTTLIERKSRMPQIKGVKGEAVASYCELLTTPIEDPASAGRWGIIGFPAG